MKLRTLKWMVLSKFKKYIPKKLLIFNLPTYTGWVLKRYTAYLKNGRLQANQSVFPIDGYGDILSYIWGAQGDFTILN